MRDFMARSPAQIASALLGVVVIVGAFGVVGLRPAGPDSPAEAAGRSDGPSAEVLTSAEWGDGQLVLTGRDGSGVDRTLTLAFLLDSGRGWRVVSSARQLSSLTDVRVGSLLVTTSEGGAGQPSWSAVYGEMGEARIARVDVVWEDGQTTAAPRAGDSYLALRAGVHRAVEARYVAADGAEIARVPVS